MLIEFSVGNYRSFKERSTLTLEASADDWLEESHVADGSGLRLLKSAAVYGANAGGKSNFLSAMRSFRDFIKNSSKESQAGEKIPVVPFLLHTATEGAPTLFEIVFLQNGTRYRYGFEATAKSIYSEWLFSQKDSTRETRLFVRENGKIEPSVEYREGKGLEERTRPNALFLSVVAQFNGNIAGEILQWMERFRNISGLDDMGYLPFTAKRLKDEKYGKMILELIRRADIGIEDLKVLDLSTEEMIKSLPKGMPEPLRKLIIQSPGNAHSIKTYHKKFDEQNKSCGLVEFDLKDNESAGTQKFIAMCGPFLHTLGEGSVLFVDELEARFHPLLTKAMVKLFNAANLNKAQLIYATHDEGLLESPLIRRDQVWFAEKDEMGASKLFSLAEFKVRKDAKFAKEYLLGEFGAVPHIRDFQQTLIHDQ